MALIGIIGDSESSVNRRLIMCAARYSPSLVIDCANIADPHMFYPKITAEQMSRIFVIEIELLYKLRDVLLRAPQMADKVNANIIVVTTSDHLFNYQDNIENLNIIQQAWDIMRFMGRNRTVIVGVRSGSVHERFAASYCRKVVYDGTYSDEPEDEGGHCDRRAPGLCKSSSRGG